MDEADLEEVDEEAQDEDHDHHDGEHAVGAKGEPLEKLLDQVVAVEPPEHQPEAVIPTRMMKARLVMRVVASMTLRTWPPGSAS